WPLWLQLAHQALHEDAVLGDRERVLALRLAVPARHTREAVGDIFDLDIERRRVQEVEPPAAQHTLPGAGGSVALHAGPPLSVQNPVPRTHSPAVAVKPR